MKIILFNYKKKNFRKKKVRISADFGSGYFQEKHDAAAADVVVAERAIAVVVATFAVELIAAAVEGSFAERRGLAAAAEPHSHRGAAAPLAEQNALDSNAAAGTDAARTAAAGQ